MSIVYNAKSAWNSFFVNSELSFPSEPLIRILKGTYPRLNLRTNSFTGKKVCDMGFGDGRNLVLLNQLGFNIYGVEITSEIVNRAILNLQEAGLHDINLLVGSNSQIPFGDNFFDYLVSWNSCYYMGEIRNFRIYIEEFARVLKSGAYLILSIPKSSCFIYKNSQTLKNGYQIIKKDPFNIRNGEVLRMFNDESEIESEFSIQFKNFIFGSIEDDYFGFNYHWHLVICQKK